MDRLAVDLDLIALRVHDEILDLQALLERHAIVRHVLAQRIADAGHELLDGKRLRHVVVSTDVEAGHLVLDLVFGRQHDDRQRRDLAHALADGQAIHARQHDIEQHKVEVALHDALIGARAVLLDLRLKALVLELDLQEARDAVLVLDNEDAYWFARLICLIHVIPSISR